MRIKTPNPKALCVEVDVGVEEKVEQTGREGGKTNKYYAHNKWPRITLEHSISCKHVMENHYITEKKQNRIICFCFVLFLFLFVCLFVCLFFLCVFFVLFFCFVLFLFLFFFLQACMHAELLSDDCSKVQISMSTSSEVSMILSWL